MTNVIKTKAGWGTPSVNITAQFEKLHGRSPNDAEAKYLRQVVKQLNQAVDQSNEVQFQFDYLLLQRYVKTLSPAGPKIQAGLTAKAQAIVKAHKAVYKSQHKSGWDFIGDAVQTAGKGFHTAIHAVSVATGEISKLASKIPLVGPAFHAVLDFAAGPLQLTDAIASGQRVDKAFIDHVNHQVADIKEAAPYAKAVISLVPGVSQGVNGLIGMGAAIANGRRIDDAFVEGMTDSLPGGPIAKSLLKVGHAALTGQPVDETILHAIPGIPDSTKDLIAKGLNTTKKIASGENIGNVALDEAMKQLPENERKALQAGIALGHGQKVQDIVVRNITDGSTLQKLGNYGIDVIKNDDTVKAALKTVPQTGVEGFNIGVGAMRHRGINRIALLTIRKNLSPKNKLGFDSALALHVGRVTMPKPAVKGEAKAGYYMTMGMRNASLKQRKGMLKNIAKNKNAAAGAKLAIRQIDHSRKTWWDKFKEFIGIAA